MMVAVDELQPCLVPMAAWLEKVRRLEKGLRRLKEKLLNKIMGEELDERQPCLSADGCEAL